MWHIKTKLGTFWIVESEEAKQRYYLGCDDEELGVYESINTIIKDIENQETGHYKWDMQPKVKAPHSIEEWLEGPPKEWESVSGR